MQAYKSQFIRSFCPNGKSDIFGPLGDLVLIEVYHHSTLLNTNSEHHVYGTDQLLSHQLNFILHFKDKQSPNLMSSKIQLAFFFPSFSNFSEFFIASHINIISISHEYFSPPSVLPNPQAITTSIWSTVETSIGEMTSWIMLKVIHPTKCTSNILLSYHTHTH